MSMDKAIDHGKEKRKPYFRSGRFDKTCRPHGGCPWCESNRKHADNVEKLGADYGAADALMEIFGFTRVKP